MGTDRSQSSMPNYGDAPETPMGIWVVAILGVVGAVLSLLAGASGLVAGAITVLAGGALILLGIAQGITMFALVGLTRWAWYVTIMLYILSAGIDLIQGDGIGIIVSLIVVAYVGIHKDLFEK
ncbi:MAG: hypothetical protein V5A52_08630 [Halovenus sp.]